MKNIAAIIVTTLFLLGSQMLHATIVGSKHDLSATNYYGPVAGASNQICVFCHTPHASNLNIRAPLWNRSATNTGAFVLYNGGAGLPNPATMACLSCHDGVSSQGDMSAATPSDGHVLLNPPNDDSGMPNCNACHPGGGQFPSKIWRIGPILTDDHPVSIAYSDALANDPTGFKPIPDSPIKLFNGNVECATCHNVHDPSNGTFLRKSNAGSGVCLSCHIR